MTPKISSVWAAMFLLAIFPVLGTVANLLELPEASLKKIHQVFKKMCEEQGYDIDSLMDQQSLKNCVSEQLKFTQMIQLIEIQEELEEAKKTGSMDEVFAKHCNKWSSVYGCVNNVTVAVRPCLTEREEKAFNKRLEIVQHLQKFMCYGDGDRLAMFVAEGGVECIQEQQDGINNCLTSTIGGRVPGAEGLSVPTLPTFNVTEEDCKDLDKIGVCVNVALEKCADTTPANMVTALFKVLKKKMPCGQTVETAAVTWKIRDYFILVMFLMILIVLVIFLKVKFY